MSSEVQEQKNPRWEKAWQENRTQWDNGKPHGALLSVLKAYEKDLFKSSPTRVLVPGCGRGYDVIHFSNVRPDVIATGLDIAETGVKAAKEYADSVKADPERARFEVQNFFELTSVEGYHIIYDITFLCALNPILRPSWGKKMAELVIPGGYLIALMFPLRPADNEGPPFALSVEVYHELLDANFEEVFIRDILQDENTEIDRSHLGAQKISSRQPAIMSVKTERGEFIPSSVATPSRRSSRLTKSSSFQSLPGRLEAKESPTRSVDNENCLVVEIPKVQHSSTEESSIPKARFDLNLLPPFPRRNVLAPNLIAATDAFCPLFIPEILCRIVEPYPIWSITDLKNAIRVCKLWKQAIEPLLYRTIIPFYPSPERCTEALCKPWMNTSQVFARLNESPRINPLRYIQRLVLSASFDPFIGSLLVTLYDMGTILKTLTLIGCTVNKINFSAFRLHAKDIHSLDLQDPQIYGNDYQSFLNLFSNLQVLSLVIDAASTMTMDESARLLEFVVERNPNLRSLDVSKWRIFNQDPDTAFASISSLILTSLTIPQVTEYGLYLLQQNHGKTLRSLHIVTRPEFPRRFVRGGFATSVTPDTKGFPYLEELVLENDPLADSFNIPITTISLSSSPVRVLQIPSGLTKSDTEILIERFANTLEVLIFPSPSGPSSSGSLPKSTLLCGTLKVLVFEAAKLSVSVVSLLEKHCPLLRTLFTRNPVDAQTMRALPRLTNLEKLVIGWGATGSGQTTSGNENVAGFKTATVKKEDGKVSKICGFGDVNYMVKRMERLRNLDLVPGPMPIPTFADGNVDISSLTIVELLDSEMRDFIDQCPSSVEINKKVFPVIANESLHWDVISAWR
ncbi:hypothetical protein HDU76_008619 [Blyttiomyces sp. JEL0837]|nr:hypothetical protein HDU76_008619 [Blyttiomyces sp. JEL0837]